MSSNKLHETPHHPNKTFQPQSNRRTKEILSSIRSKLIDKYGNEESTIACVDNCITQLAEKDKKIKIDDFALMELKLKKQLDVIQTAKKTIRNQERAKEIRHISNIQHFGLGGISHQSPRALEKLKADEAAELLKDKNIEKRYGTKQFEALQLKVSDK